MLAWGKAHLYFEMDTSVVSGRIILSAYVQRRDRESHRF